MKNIAITVILFIVLCATNTLAREIEVSVGYVCTSVENYEPIGADTSFDSLVGKLYCFTRISGVKVPPVTVTHVWYFEKKEVFRIELPIKASSYRTYSSKSISPSQIGNWEVHVLGPDNDILRKFTFTVGY